MPWQPETFRVRVSRRLPALSLKGNPGRRSGGGERARLEFNTPGMLLYSTREWQNLLSMTGHQESGRSVEVGCLGFRFGVFLVMIAVVKGKLDGRLEHKQYIQVLTQCYQCDQIGQGGGIPPAIFSVKAPRLGCMREPR